MSKRMFVQYLKTIPEMRNKSILPYLILLFAGIVALGHFSHKPSTGKQNQQQHLPGLSIGQSDQYGRNFQKITDTTLSTGFHLKNYYVNTGDAPGLKLNYDPRKIEFETIPVMDTILEFYYEDRLIFKEVSLKELASTSDPDKGFWSRAGLETFEVDMEQSDRDALVCRFSFLNYDSETSRNFLLYIDRQGKTRFIET